MMEKVPRGTSGGLHSCGRVEPPCVEVVSFSGESGGTLSAFVGWLVVVVIVVESILLTPRVVVLVFVIVSVRVADGWRWCSAY